MRSKVGSPMNSLGEFRTSILTSGFLHLTLQMPFTISE